MRKLFIFVVSFACAAHAQVQAPTPKQARAADDAYLAGARQLVANDPAAAERSFSRAVELDPTKPDYTRSLALARQHHVTQLVQQAAQLRAKGKTAEAALLIDQATALDPTNLIVTEHALAVASPDTLPHPIGDDELRSLGGAVHLTPPVGKHSFRRTSNAEDLLREVYGAFGVKVMFDPGITQQQIRFALDDADFDTATRVLLRMSHAFAIPLTRDSVLIARDSQENRDRLQPLIEETVYVPAMASDQLAELSNIAKNIFDIKQVTISASGQSLVLRAPEDALQLVNATYADLLDGGAEVMLDIHLYEVDQTHERNIGFVLPTSAGVIALAPALQSFVASNQALLTQIIASGALTGKLTGSYYRDLATEAIALFAAGVPLPAQLTNIVGFFGNFGKYTNAAGQLVGLPLAGLFLGSGATFNLALNSSDVRLVDDIQLRVADRQLGTFRAGTRYPITTSTYSSGNVSSALSSQLAGIKIGGVPASNLLSQLQTTQVPQIQFEDLGLTLKATPQVLKSGQVFVHLELKLEALGGGMINNIPILNSRQLTSDVTIPEAQTAVLVSQASVQEIGAITGVPGLNEVPGFQGTDKDANKDTQEILITITPHLTRRRSATIASRRLPANLAPSPE